MENIYLNDLLNLTKEDLKNAKIRFHQWNGYNDPMELYKNNPDIINNQWLFWRGKQRYFSVGQIAICLLKLSDERWLLTTVKRISKELGKNEGINYEGEELKEYNKYFGRVIIKYHKTIPSQGRYYADICNELEVEQILPAIFDGDDFPGYDKVRLSYYQLKTVLDRGKRDWIAALENQKAVYLITDTFNGKMYVGSATSDKGMLLQRWKEYVKNGHGGNKELKRIVDEQKLCYIEKYFQYSILENYNSKIEDEVIKERESWWKETLKTRQFGYNDN